MTFIELYSTIVEYTFLSSAHEIFTYRDLSVISGDRAELNCKEETGKLIYFIKLHPKEEKIN